MKKKPQDRIETIVDVVTDLIGKAKVTKGKLKVIFETALAHFLGKVRTYLYKTLLEITFFILSLIFLIAGTVLFISRYFSLDVLLIIAGLICLVIALFLRISLLKKN